MLGPDNAIWDDGEWLTWADVNSHLYQLEMGERFPNADAALVETFRDLLDVAQQYFYQTGKHLQVYGDLGELFGAITYGIRLNKNYAQGSDGRLGKDHVEVKTITPFKTNDTVQLNLERNFNKVFIVRISEDFEIEAKMIDRKSLPKNKSKRLQLRWSTIDTLLAA